MSGDQRKGTWALTVSPEYRKDSNRIPAKYRNQVSRKTHDLMYDPTPGGSRTPLAQYPGLCRLRAGEFRVIYAYNDSVVELLSLRRRDEHTYDDLDLLEVMQFEEFRRISGGGPVQHSQKDWAELAKDWAAPQPRTAEPLPKPLTPEALAKLGVPAEYHEALGQLRSVDDLLRYDLLPSEIAEAVLEYVCPRAEAPLKGDPLPVVLREDLIDDFAAEVNGPLDTSAAAPSQAPSARPDDPSVPAPLLLVATRRQEPMTPYRGNVAKGIGQDARYTVKLNGTVQLTYAVSSDERALLTTDGHSDLVAMVNEAKRRGGSAQGGGAFIINEYRHVLVPTSTGEVLYAGDYTRDLEFSNGGSLVSPVARSGIRPGDVWPGPHVGIKYTLAAGATDVRYDRPSASGVVQRVCLTDHYSTDALRELLDMLRAVKPTGGAIYINEARELFAPTPRGDTYERVYIGHLGNRPWFPSPVS